MALTVLTIKNLKPRDTAYRVADGGGLCIEIAPTGSKLWRWCYKLNGKSQLVALGKFPEVSLEKARKLRDEVRLQVNSGKHPTREKKLQKLRRITEGENTFERVARHWMETKQKGLNQKYVTQNLARMEQRVFPMIGNEIRTPLEFGRNPIKALKIK